MQSDYGDICLKKIVEGCDFWCLIHEMQDDNSVFMNNISTIVERYKEEKLFGLYINENDSMFKRGARKDLLFCRSFDKTLSWYLLPCFCTIIDENTAEICWVHSRATNIGIGKTLVKKLNINKVFNPLKESILFWKKCGITDFL